MHTAELKRLVAAGDIDAAFAALHRDHAAEVARFVRARVGDRAEADDVCQEVWSALARALAAFRFDAQPRVWILSIARFKSMDAWRRHAGGETLDSQILDGGPLGSLIGVRAVTTPSRALERRRRAAAVHEVLAALDPHDRELIELRYVAGLKPAEIVRVMDLDVEPNTIAQRIVRATRRLRAALLDHQQFASRG